MVLLLWLACSDDKPSTGDTAGAPDSSGDTTDSAGTDSADTADDTDSTPVDTNPPDSGDSDTGEPDTGDTADSDSAGDSGDTGTPPEPVPVRFVVLGDGGEGNDTQYAVADAMLAVCATKTDADPGCEFALYLGDNFYDDGVAAVDDEQFQTKFELPYADLTFPFYVVLGNHDYGSLSLLGYKADYEIAYTAYSSKWTLPDHSYSFVVENVLFLGLDTNQIMLESLWGDSGQGDWLDNEIAAAGADWNITFGHHPYRSNGAHGNAGEYEGYDWLPIANGATVEDFMDAHFCGQVDLYFAGHDHNRQWLEPYCEVELVVSGAAAKTTDLEDRGNTTWFEDDSTAGFMWVEIRGDTMIGEFYDEAGALSYRGEVTRRP